MPKVSIVSDTSLCFWLRFQSGRTRNVKLRFHWRIGSLVMVRTRTIACKTIHSKPITIIYNSIPFDKLSVRPSVHSGDYHYIPRATNAILFQ